jgi:hypothetical protein
VTQRAAFQFSRTTIREAASSMTVFKCHKARGADMLVSNIVVEPNASQSPGSP